MFIKNPLIQTLHVSWLKEKCSIINIILSDKAVVNSLHMHAKPLELAYFLRLIQFIIQMSYETKVKITKKGNKTPNIIVLEHSNSQ